jgi:hypothetical protein
MIMWIGSADLSVELVVADADTGQPIQGARVTIICETGDYDGAEDDMKKPFELRTDDAGVARRLLPNNWRSGTTSLLRFSDTCHPRKPGWQLRVSALGYQASEWRPLWDEGSKVVCGKGEPDRLVARIGLHKLQREPPGE